ncbi:MAG: 50S ribosomal protein L32 [Parcubacteria group bacterium]|jgi:large subunit ribosomal protein L32|nr:50S ribosomal protein L32 [Parcubacteria group bacterium]|tara:strand:- start:6225 stop:6425 length:201 start_codon:yes stop_codon:yes gene_type:complete
MSVSKKRKSSAKTKRGRSHQSLTKVKLIKCAKCGKATLPHQVCSFCGSYKGKEIIKPKIKKKKEGK